MKENILYVKVQFLERCCLIGLTIYLTFKCQFPFIFDRKIDISFLSMTIRREREREILKVDIPKCMII